MHVIRDDVAGDAGMAGPCGTLFVSLGVGTKLYDKLCGVPRPLSRETLAREVLAPAKTPFRPQMNRYAL